MAVDKPSARSRFAVISDGLPSQLPDIDPEETAEWVESLDGVIDERGRQRARYVMLRLLERARERQVGRAAADHHRLHQHHPARARSRGSPATSRSSGGSARCIRWNAAMLVHRAQRPGIGVGGHISTFASSPASTRSASTTSSAARTDPGGGDQIFFQGHASPGMYARAFLEGRLTEAAARRLPPGAVARAGGGLPSYPHPRLMPDFWEFPTVSMGLGPLNAIYQARFNRYLHHRGIKDTSRPARLGVPRRRRDGRAGVARRARPGRPRGAGQPHLRHQLQPAAPRRPGPRQRQGHPGAGGVLPRRRLERHQGGLGPRVGPAARRRTPTARWST